eukprot:9479656-Pyramimonas_sp.AAC.1
MRLAVPVRVVQPPCRGRPFASRSPCGSWYAMGNRRRVWPEVPLESPTLYNAHGMRPSFRRATRFLPKWLRNKEVEGKSGQEEKYEQEVEECDRMRRGRVEDDEEDNERYIGQRKETH